MGNQTDTIFLIGEGGHLEEAPYSAYAAEDVLQRLVADHPQVLVGHQIDPADPPRWLLVKREATVPDAEGANRWSLDHLLIDQSGRPTLVEVKRSSDTRIRREVVGQMLDYAANAVRYWPIADLQRWAAETAGGEEELEVRLQEFLANEAGDEVDTEAIWVQVAEQLREGSVRLLFVADEIPGELRSIIEFMNEQMPRVDVLGVELRQYVAKGARVLVPRVVGRTERAAQSKVTRKVGQTDLATFAAACGPVTAPFFETIVREARARTLVVYWGVKGFSVRVPRGDGKLISIYYGYPPDSTQGARAEAYLQYIEDDSLREQYKQNLLSVAPYLVKGDHTLRLEVDAESIAAATRSLDVVWATADRIRETGSQTGSSEWGQESGG